MTYRKAEDTSDVYDPRRHLWVVCSDPPGDRAVVITMSLCSIRSAPSDDLTCLLQVGEHPFVVKPTFVFYRNVLLVDPGRIDAAFRAGVLIPGADMPRSVVQRMLRGALASPFVADAVKTLVRAQLA